jgi:hypothetical protein
VISRQTKGAVAAAIVFAVFTIVAWIGVAPTFATATLAFCCGLCGGMAIVMSMVDTL